MHFPPPPPVVTCEIKVLILLYTPEKRAFLGFVPNNQTGFVDRLRKVIQQKQILGKQVKHRFNKRIGLCFLKLLAHNNAFSLINIHLL